MCTKLWQFWVWISQTHWFYSLDFFKCKIWLISQTPYKAESYWHSFFVCLFLCFEQPFLYFQSRLFSNQSCSHCIFQSQWCIKDSEEAFHLITSEGLICVWGLVQRNLNMEALQVFFVYLRISHSTLPCPWQFCNTFDRCHQALFHSRLLTDHRRNGPAMLSS